MQDSALLEERRLAWPACANIRDLGGLPAQAPRTRTVQPGRFVRADVLSSLTEQGWQALIDHGVRTVIDLRSAPEVARASYTVPETALSAGVNRIHLSMLPLDAEMMELLKQAATRGDEYILFVDRYQVPTASIIKTIAAAAPGAVLYHCQAGKDRTGIVTALLLGIAGVPEEIMIEDYAESQRRLWPGYLRQLQAPREPDEEPPFQPIADPQTLRTLLAHWKRRYGGIQGYLRTIGVTDAEIATLAARLMD